MIFTERGGGTCLFYHSLQCSHQRLLVSCKTADRLYGFTVTVGIPVLIMSDRSETTMLEANVTEGTFERRRKMSRRRSRNEKVKEFEKK